MAHVRSYAAADTIRTPRWEQARGLVALLGLAATLTPSGVGVIEWEASRPIRLAGRRAG